jgi:hypothetical protein
MTKPSSISLSHWSPQPIIALQSCPQPPSQTPVDKPRGLWVSAASERSWSAFCESIGLPLGSFCYDVHLAADAHILFIDDAAGLDSFTEEFGTAVPLGFMKGIDWPGVAAQYQGILVVPYIHQRRLTLHTLWYYGWDCAGGCIWDATAIDSLQPRPSSFSVLEGSPA